MMSDMLFISQVPAYLYMAYSVRRTRRAVSYWTTRGLMVKDKRVRLKTERTSMGDVYTRKSWVDDFICKVSRR